MSYITPWSGSLDEGTYEVDMPANLQVGTSTYNFGTWEDNSTNPKRAINLVSDMSISAGYVLATAVVTVVAGSGGSVSPSGAQTLTVGQTYQFNALPDSGYQLDHWDLGGSNIGSTNPISITATLDMDGKTLTAIFTTVPIPQVTMTVACDSTKGSVTPSAGAHQFNIGDTVQFTATPLAGFVFSSWTLNGTTYSTNPLNLPITSAMDGKTLTAQFTVSPPISPSPFQPFLDWWGRRTPREKVIVISGVPLTIYAVFKLVKRRG
jgi:hypothetical protein